MLKHVDECRSQTALMRRSIKHFCDYNLAGADAYLSFLCCSATGMNPDFLLSIATVLYVFRLLMQVEWTKPLWYPLSRSHRMKRMLSYSYSLTNHDSS